MKKFQRPLDIFDSEVLDCVYGQYPWDDWERKALAAGVPKDLAALGRLTVREAYQHEWDDRLKSLCGWYDQGRRMIKLALRSPAGPPTLAAVARHGRLSRGIRRGHRGVAILDMNADLARLKQALTLWPWCSRGVSS